MVHNNWISKQIAYINSNVGLYKPTGKFYFEPTQEFYETLENGYFDTINDVIHKICKFIGCNFEPNFEGWINSSGFIIKEDNIVSSEPENRAGNIYSKNVFNSKIHLNAEFMDKPIILGAIIAHEITHQILFEKGLKYGNDKENEKFTDVAGNFFGMGKLLLNGYSKSKNRIGYIPYEILADINIEICKFRNIDINVLKENLNKNAMTAVSKSYSSYRRKEKIESLKNKISKLFSFLSVLKRNKESKNNKKSFGNKESKYNKTESIVIICGKCGQKMRFPKKNKTLKAKCPSCGNKIIVKPKK